jgi:hypothetical protein
VNGGRGRANAALKAAGQRLGHPRHALEAQGIERSPPFKKDREPTDGGSAGVRYLASALTAWPCH